MNWGPVVWNSQLVKEDVRERGCKVCAAVPQHPAHYVPDRDVSLSSHSTVKTANIYKHNQDGRLSSRTHVCLTIHLSVQLHFPSTESIHQKFCVKVWSGSWNISFSSEQQQQGEHLRGIAAPAGGPSFRLGLRKKNDFFLRSSINYPDAVEKKSKHSWNTHQSFQHTSAQHVLTYYRISLKNISVPVNPISSLPITGLFFVMVRCRQFEALSREKKKKSITAHKHSEDHATDHMSGRDGHLNQSTAAGKSISSPKSRRKKPAL